MEKKNIKQIYQFLGESVTKNIKSSTKTNVLKNADNLFEDYENFKKSVQTMLDVWVQQADETLESYCKGKLHQEKEYYSDEDALDAVMDRYKAKNGLCYSDFIFDTPFGKFEYNDTENLKAAILKMMVDDELKYEKIELLTKAGPGKTYDIFFRYTEHPTFPNSVGGWEWCYGGDF